MHCILCGPKLNQKEAPHRFMTKPTKWLCAQWRLKSAWEYAQSDQSLLGRCPGWSESSLGTQSSHFVGFVMWRLTFIFFSKVFSTTGSSKYDSCSTTKPTKWSVHPAKTQISLGISPVWSESSLCTQRVAKDPGFLHADNERLWSD